MKIHLKGQVWLVLHFFILQQPKKQNLPTDRKTDKHPDKTSSIETVKKAQFYIQKDRKLDRQKYRDTLRKKYLDRDADILKDKHADRDKDENTDSQIYKCR